jgi:hypothetical protein
VDRLDYEQKAIVAAGRQIPRTPSEDESFQSQVRLPDFSRVSYGRILALQALHDQTASMFLNAPGFGVTRMIRGDVASVYESESIRLAQPVALPQPSECGRTQPITTEDSLLSPERPTWNKPLEMLHESGRSDFLNPLAFGYVKNRNEVTGFTSHRFTKYPTYSNEYAPGSWRIDALDLISMLKHKEPVAYVSKHLPRMDELRDAPTRPLDDFERERLPKLQAGEELSAGQGPRRIRMLGAIRAQDLCLNCHTANKDDLLGAFSYDLRLDLPESGKR